MSQRIKWIFLVSMVISLLLAGCGGKSAQDSMPLTASLSELEGAVEIKQPGQDQFETASNGMTLEVNGTVRTGEDGRLRLDLSSGTIIRVAPLTTFVMQSNIQSDDGLVTQLEMEAGRVWVILQGGSLDVDTPSGVASVRGSYLSVWIDPVTNDVWVGCVEGWCHGENLSDYIDMFTGQGCILYFWDPTSNVPPPPPYLRYLTQEEIDLFLQNNPEAQEAMNAIYATASALPTLTPTSTASPTATPEDFCFSLITPANDGTLPISGMVDFTWEPQTGAAFYNWVLTPPSGPPLSAVVPGTIYSFFLGSIPAGGTYTWQVTAMDASAQPICTAGPHSFTKDAYSNTATATSTSTPTSTATPTGAGNTVFSNEYGPTSGDLCYDYECIGSFGVSVTDPEGVASVWVYFYTANGYSGSVGPLLWDPYDMVYYGYYVYIIGGLEPTTVYWYFAAQDQLGNWQASPNVYSIQDTCGCVDLPQ